MRVGIGGALGIVVIGALVATIGVRSVAFADGGLAIQIVSIDDSGFPQLTAIVSVESQGRPLTTLDPGGVTVTDNGSAVHVDGVTRVQDANLPTNIVLALDTSGSMAGEKLARAKEAITALALRLGPNDSVGLIAFSDAAQLVVPMGKDNGGVGAALAPLQAQGNTALYSAVAQSAKVSAAGGATRRLVILLTDGEEYGNVSGLTRDESLAQAVQSGAIFYVIGLGSGADHDYLVSLASQTGGKYLDAPAAADIQSGYASIEAALKGQFVIALTTSAPAAPLSRNIVLDVKAGTQDGQATYSFDSTRTLVATPVPATVAPPTPELSATVASVPETPATSPTAKPSSGGLPVVAVASLGAVLAIVAAGAVTWRVRRNAPPALPVPGLLHEEAHSAADEPMAAPVGRLVPLDPAAGTIETAVVSGEPVTVGWDPACQLRLPRDAGFTALHARLWWKDGRVMVHALKGGQTSINGHPVHWASLNDGDSIRFGPYAYEYRVAPRVVPAL